MRFHDECSHCGTPWVEREYPRKLQTQRDRDWTAAAGFRQTAGHVVWIPRLYCAHSWRAALRGMDGALIEQLLPDPDVQQELRRRALPVTRRVA